MPLDLITSAGLEVAQMSKAQKLAAFMVILGADAAGKLLKNLEVRDLEIVSMEILRLPLITQEVQTEILKEFTGVAVEATTCVRGGLEFTQSALEKGVGPFRAADILGRIIPNRPPVQAMQEILDMESRPLANLLKHEQAQTIALVASYLSPEKASQLLSLLPEGVREKVVERLATLAPTPVEVIERVANVLKQKIATGKPSRAPTQTGGLKTAADLLNALNKDLSKSILASLDEHNPELGEAIRNKMFTFEDLVTLDSTAVQKILREVDLRDLAMALKNAQEALKKKILGCISKRAAETVNEEITCMGSVKTRDIDSARGRVIEVLRRLETEGEIDLSDVRENSRHAVLG